MAEYIFTERNGIYIIDLQKTVKKVEEAYMFVRNVVMEGGTILFVGTKKQAQEAIKDEAIRSEMYFVNVRWLGGYAYQLQDDKEEHPEAQQPRKNVHRRNFRPSPQERGRRAPEGNERS